MRLITAQLVVLDLDDTLFLERQYVCSGFRAVDAWVQQHFMRGGFERRALDYFEGGTRGSIFDRVMADLGLPADSATIQALVNCYRRHDPDISLLPDAKRLQRRLTGRLPIAVITDGPLDSQMAKARRLGLHRWVDRIVFTDHWGLPFRKPHPRAFRDLQSRYGVPPQLCVYLADNPRKDFVAPRRLGWQSVHVRRRQGIYAGRPWRSRDSADVVVPNLDAIRFNCCQRRHKHDAFAGA